MPHSIKAYKDFFESNINHTEKLRAVREYLKNDRSAELFWDMTRPTPYTYFVYDEQDNLTGQYGADSLWRVINNNAPIRDGGEVDAYTVDHIYRKAKRFIDNN